MRIFAAIAMSCCLVPLQAQASALGSPAEVERSIKLSGASRTWAELSAEHQWEGLLDKVSAGQPGWLKVAADLRTGTDAGASEGLDAAISEAIRRRPAEVLRLFQSGVSAENVCRSRAIEPTPEQVRTFVGETRTALEGVKDPALRQARDQCIALVAKS